MTYEKDEDEWAASVREDAAADEVELNNESISWLASERTADIPGLVEDAWP